MVAAGYTVYAVNPLQAARYRERHGVSGAKSDKADAHALADMVRTDAHQLRPVAADSPQAEAIKVVARAHKTLIWERTRHTLRLRYALREYFPAALEAFDDLAAPDTLELLAKAPDPASAAKLTAARSRAALKRARRRDIDRKSHPRSRPRCAANSSAAAPVITARLRRYHPLDGRRACHPQRADQHAARAGETHFGRHPDAEISCPNPASGVILGARVLAEFGDAPAATPTRRPARTTPAPARSPASPASARSCTPGYVHNDRLVDALMSRPSPRCRPHPAPAPTTTSSAPAGSATTPRCASSPTGSSASCTAASRPAPSTTSHRLVTPPRSTKAA